MPSEPLAYLLTWTTYGTWLPGDERGWVRSGDGVQPPDPDVKQGARRRMTRPPVILNEAERRIVEDAIVGVRGFRGWQLHAVNARTNHVHVVVTASGPPEPIRDQLKAWCSRKLSDHAGLGEGRSGNGRRKWFTEGGSVRYLWDAEYFANAVRYVVERQ